MIGTISHTPERSREEAADLLREIAGGSSRPLKLALNRAMARVAPHLKLSYSRLRHIWYGDVRLIRTEETGALRAAAEAMRRKREAGRAAASERATLYQGVAQRLRDLDADEHRTEITRLERLAREVGPLDSAGASPSRVAPPAPGNGGGNV